MKAKHRIRRRNRAAAKRRVAYSLAASAAAATVASSAAEGAIVYSGLQDISIDSGFSQTIEVQTTYFPLSTIYGDILLKNYVFNGGGSYQGLNIHYAPGKVVGSVHGFFSYPSALTTGAVIDGTSLVPANPASLAYNTHNPNAAVQQRHQRLYRICFPNQ